MNQTTKNAIVANFDANISRVRSLLEVYDQLAASGPGRPSVAQTDILRAGIVLLHASLEDLIRTSSEHLLPLGDVAVLDDIGFPMPDGKNVERSRLGVLARFRSDSVQDVIRVAVAARLQRSNYNNVNEVGTALERIGVNRNVLSPDEASIEAMMKRRHLVVHRADKDPRRVPRRGVTLAQHLQKTTAERVFRYSDRAWRQRRLFRRLREEGACSKHVTDERKWLKRREPARRRENT